MDINSAASVAAVVVLLLPVVVLACLGVLFVKGLTTYNTPMLPNGCPGLAQRGQIVKGAFQLSLYVPTSK